MQKKWDKSKKIDLSHTVTAEGFEPPTLRAEIWYSIQLNYAVRLFTIFDIRCTIYDVRFTIFDLRYTMYNISFASLRSASPRVDLQNQFNPKIIIFLQ